MTFEDIKSFCNQGLSEGQRIEYKTDFPKNLKLAETVCAFANSEGGILLIGVQADKTENKPIAIPGIQLTEGLEERVISICLSHISPTYVPEVKVCDFKSNQGNRAVLLIRVRSSYFAPHYLLDNNKIVVRTHSTNSLADLRTIENLIDRREKVRTEGAPPDVFYQAKIISVESEAFENVVIAPHFPSEPFIDFYNKENTDHLFKIANEVLSLNDRRPEIWQLACVSLNSFGQTTRLCNIGKEGKILFQRTASVEENRLNLAESIALLIRALKAAKKIYSHFGFYGDLSVGITIVDAQDLLLGLPKHKYIENFKCGKKWIHVSRTLRYDDLSHLNQIIESIFKELCVHFGAVLPEQTVVDIVTEIFSHYR